MSRTTLFILLMILSINNSFGQEIECNEAILTLSDDRCEDNGGNDFIIFSLQVTTNSGNSASAFINQIPMNSTVVIDGGMPIPIPSNFYFIDSGEVAIFNIPTTDCEPLNLTTIIFNEGICNDVALLVDGLPNRGIPTIGQWGLIVLGLVLSSLGVLWIKRREKTLDF